jgi:hypothetical protein
VRGGVPVQGPHPLNFVGQVAVTVGVEAVLPVQFLEPFPSWLCFAELQYVGGLGELTGAPGGWKVPARPKLDLATAGVS